jgi:DNA replication licensing factor MCM3
MQAESRTVEQHKRKFSTFLEFDEYQEKFDSKIKEAIDSKKFRFIVNINELRSFEDDLANKIIRRPREYIVALQEAGIERSKKIDPSFEKVLKSADLQVGFEGSFGRNSVSPRGLNSSMLNSLVQVEGIITKVSSVRPKLQRSVQYCPVTKLWSIRDYRDATSIDIGIEVTGGSGERLPTSSALPTSDANGNPLEIEHGLCMYKDYQTLVLQEMPEKARVGQLPRSVDVILEHDLVDRAKPGDRIVCVGVYRTLPTTQQGNQTTGAFRTVLMCNNVSIIGKEIGAVQLTGTDIKNIRYAHSSSCLPHFPHKFSATFSQLVLFLAIPFTDSYTIYFRSPHHSELSQRKDVLEVMSRALCPSIFGHDFIKKALILQLLGGCERNLENGTHLRGDINVMFVGDPSTAKSQLLRAVLDIAPLAISTTGRGSTGVGLTAAVTVDPETGDKRLEAGAMVLADRGVVCIDEFDKMSEVSCLCAHLVFLLGAPWNAP